MNNLRLVKLYLYSIQQQERTRHGAGIYSTNCWIAQKIRAILSSKNNASSQTSAETCKRVNDLTASLEFPSRPR